MRAFVVLARHSNLPRHRTTPNIGDAPQHRTCTWVRITVPGCFKPEKKLPPSNPWLDLSWLSKLPPPSSMANIPADIICSTEGEFARVHLITDGLIKHPVYIHKHLLNRRALQVGSIYRAQQAEHIDLSRDQHDSKHITPGITDIQEIVLREQLKNTKKTKWAVQLSSLLNTSDENQFSYYDIIDQPVDLSTIESKLERKQYGSLQAYADDFQLMSDNAEKFFGPQHNGTLASQSLLAYVQKHMARIPGPGQTRGKVQDQASSSKMEVFTVEVELRSRRALRMWSSWLYGGKMWHREDCTDVDNDLSCLASIYKLGAGRGPRVGRDSDALNACLDAMRQILLDENLSPTNPLQVLDDQLNLSGSGLSKMLVDLLVYGKCASEGKTRDWLHIVEGRHSEFFRALSHEFANKVMGGVVPDLRARCAYHFHPTGSSCGDAA